MNTSSLDNDLRAAAARYVAAIDVPPCDGAAIRSRSGAQHAVADGSTLRGAPRSKAVAIGTAALLLAAVPGVPTVVAQVQRAVHAFVLLHGRRVPLEVRTVSFAQARADMPFAVIVPAGIPPGLRLTIRELRSQESPALSHLVFDYAAGAGDMPGLMIDESADVGGSGAPQAPAFFFRERVGAQVGAPLPPLPQSEQGTQLRAQGCLAQLRQAIVVRGTNGPVVHCSAMQPVTWTEHGTRVTLVAPPDFLTAAQIATIHAAMLR